MLMPTLGGNNGYATGANNSGQVVGFAETANQDPTCVPPQVLDYEAVIWNPGQGSIQMLPPARLKLLRFARSGPSEPASVFVAN